MSRSKSKIIARKLSFSDSKRENLKSAIDGIMGGESSFRLNNILYKKWKVFRVSPIYNFDTNKLKFYGKKLCRELCVKKRLGLGSSYKSSFTINKSLKLNDEFVEVLQVKVIKNHSTNVYLGFFISSNNSKKDLHDSMSLPILLVEGNGQEIYDIHSSLCKMFDCDIQPVTFSFYALITFLVKLLENPQKSTDVSQEVLSMEYKIPGCKNNDTIKVTFLLEDAIIILAVIIDNLREKVRGITNMEIMLEFYNRLLNHIFNVYKVDLMLAELHKIIFPYSIMTADGQLKISTEDAATTALGILQHFLPLNSISNV